MALTFNENCFQTKLSQYIVCIYMKLQSLFSGKKKIYIKMSSVEIVELSTYRTTGKYPFSKHKPKLNTAEETVVIKIIDYNAKNFNIHKNYVALKM